MHLAPRQDTACPSPQLFYSCSSNGFYGCCSVDPCGIANCPEIPIKLASSEKTSLSLNSQNNKQTSSAEESILVLQSSQTSSYTTTESTFKVPTISKPQTSSTTAATQNTLAPAVVLITSTIINQVPSKGAIWTTSTSTFLSTASPSSDPLEKVVTVGTSSISSLPTKGAVSSSKSDHKAIIGGVVGGVSGAVAILISIWICLFWMKKRKGRRSGLAIDDDPRLQGFDANRSGEAIENYITRNKIVTKNFEDEKIRKLQNNGLPDTSTAGCEGKHKNVGRKWPCSSNLFKSQKSHEETIPYLDSQPRIEMADTSVDPVRPKSELPDTPSINHVAELPSHPESSHVYSPNRSSATASSSNVANTEKTPHTFQDMSLMRPSLGNSTSTSGYRNSQTSDGNGHVMSWMNYEDAAGHTQVLDENQILVKGRD